MADTWIVDEASSGERLDKFLAAAGSRWLARPRDRCARARPSLRQRRRSDTDRCARRRLVSRRPGEVLARSSRQRRSGTPRAARPGELPIVYEDDALIVVNKPPGLLAVPLERQEDATSVQDELVLHLRSKGKTTAARRSSHRSRHVRPRRLRQAARCTGEVEGSVSTPRTGARLSRGGLRSSDTRVRNVERSPRLGSEAAHSEGDAPARSQRSGGAESIPGRRTAAWRVADRGPAVTGRRNQIRLQARLHGHTLIGEARYTYGPEALRPIEFPRQALHAHRLAFRHPLTGQPLSFEAPLPIDMQGLIGSLR